MENIVVYLMRASIYLLVFALGYAILFRRNVNPQFNRFYILFASFATIILSFIPVSSIAYLGTEAPVSSFVLPEIVVISSNGFNSTIGHFGSSVSQLNPILIAILSISFGFLLVLFWQLTRIFILISKHQQHELSGMKLVVLPVKTPPFSFFGWLFVSSDLQNEVYFGEILAHEKAHYSKKHSLDIVFFEILRIFFWFHPAYYFLRHELKAMHEFEADAEALTTFDKITYQKTLLEMSISGGLIPITNPFNVSLIKKRMLMMNQQKRQKPAYNWLKLLMLLPFMVATILVQSCQFEKKEAQTSPDQEKVTVTEMDKSGKITTTEKHPSDLNVTAPENGEPFTVVEVMPVYPGGTEAMMQFISQNIHYPEQAKKDTIQGKVFINFIIEADGRVTSAKVLRGIGGGCDEEAVRVVNMMPNWTPGQQRGQNVRVSFNLPVRFALQ